MTGADLHRQARSVLRDTGRGLATESRLYGDEELINAFYAARAELFARMLERDPIPYVTFRSLIKECSATSGTAVPLDFYRVMHGKDANGKYVPHEDIVRSTALEGQPAGYGFVGVAAGLFLGTAVTATYWAMPQEPLTKYTSSLREFPDGFYRLIKQLACRNLLLKERADALLRWSFVDGLIKRSILTLR